MGQGGSAFILKAFSEWNLSLAVKFIKLNQNQQNQEDYKREYEILKIFNSPYILKVFTFYNKSNSKNLSYQIIVMERCKYDLRRYINKVIYPQQSDNLLNIYLLSLQLAKGLQVLHQNNIIHLDIKPGNILYGYDQSWKFADFGIAKVVSDDRTFTNQLQGFTMRYSSPEQYLLAMGVPSTITRASDVYSLGIIFLELTGVDITQQWIVEQKSCALDFDEYLNPQFERFNSMIVKKMIQFKPENRISLQEVIQILSAFITQQISFTKKLINPMVKGYKISIPVKPIVKAPQEEKPQSKSELTNIKEADPNKEQSQQQLQQIPLEDKQQHIYLKQSKRSFHNHIEISQNELSNSPRRLRSIHRSMDYILSERSNSLYDKKHLLMQEIENKNQLKLKLNEIPSKNIQKSSPQNQQSPAYLFQKQQNPNKQFEFSKALKDIQFKSPQQKNFFVTPIDQMYKKQ
ncbi:Serine/Threonine kinase domain protein (macronuclear) [Tetrahymena thermophila SB210]|uniref:non-specific serine/threonine protein kinase n=1 Tax=Tetrahymena thermophila (strain SB210) TaxID=312017 RepID=I7MDC6_TETTS|nr:Serine/Threonine kinase domain protein [Tetrahymena thermophila SB210]EAR87331.2 Serine/Threonine kinase domain protein [Tetrahymena thermophila SB210]|eukprot:XP_001007576.2 Serine/Threonine kinase domain protein [Tetrahymena thermophila SB210]